MNPPFVKKFDFRGEYNKDLKDEDAFYLGLAIEKTISPKKVLIGWDTRISSKNLAYNFINAIKNKNIEIFYLDKCPIDYVTAAAYASDFDFSVMFTGSHNPWTWTGLLMHTKGGDSVAGELVEQIIEKYNSVADQSYKQQEIDLSNFNNYYAEIEEIYANKIKSLIPLSEITRQKIIVDIGDGSGSRSLALLEKLLPQVKFERLNDRNLYDENTPHIADPSEIKYMQQLTEKVKSGGYTCGFAFDSDADRVLAVDETGEYINGSILAAAHIKSFIDIGMADNVFGYAVDCGLAAANSVVKINKELGDEFKIIPTPVGRSIQRKLLRDGNVDLGIENVGHFYSKDFFMTDSGTFSTAIVLYWITKNGPLSKLKIANPDGFRGQSSCEILSKDKVNEIAEEINSNIGLGDSKKIEVDGIRVEFYQNGLLSAWYTIRNSGYEPITKCYWGAIDESIFNFLKDKLNSISK